MMRLAEITPGEPAFRHLTACLDAARLTTIDLADGDVRYFALRDGGNEAVGFGGLAGVGTDLLLRSVVVEPGARGTGMGRKLIAALETESRLGGATALWLLTEDSAAFFERVGYEPAPRTSTPPVVRASRQFQGLCSASAALLRKWLVQTP